MSRRWPGHRDPGRVHPPAVAQDGGDILYRGMDDGIVLLKLIGSCHSCPSSTATLAQGVERMLLEEVPEVQGVRQVED